MDTSLFRTSELSCSALRSLVHTASRSVCCGSILLEVEVVGINTKCFQLRKQEVLQHGYVPLRINCDGFLIIIFKEKWSHNPKSSHPTPYCHLRRVQWLFVQLSGIHWCPIAHILFIHETGCMKMRFVAHQNTVQTILGLH